MQVLLDVAINSGYAAIFLLWLWLVVITALALMDWLNDVNYKLITPAFIMYAAIVLGMIITAWRAL